MKRITEHIVSIIIVLVLTASSYAVLLNDAQLYFEPDSIVADYYPRIELQDLSVDNDYLWSAESDLVIDADILPILKAGEYQPGYVFGQADYDQQPNVDYFADLTEGNLQCTFIVPGLYHVRITRDSGSRVIYAVFAETGFKEKDASDKSGASKKLDPIPDGDLFIVEKSDKLLDNSAKIWENAGKDVKRVENRQQVIDEIKKKSKALGRKIHVEIDGHGKSGNISTGAGKDNIPDKQIDLDSVAKFQKAIDDHVDHITFQGCSVGSGDDGKKFLKILADSIGKAGAWDKPVKVVDQSHFAIPLDASWEEENIKSKAAHNFDPTTSDTACNTCIDWDAGSDSSVYEAYFGTDYNAVQARDESAFATVTESTFFDPGILEADTTYYYVVDSKGGTQDYTGDIWSFTTGNFVKIDGFEDYTNDSPNRVFQTWLDGCGFSPDEFFLDGYEGNGSGSMVGHDIWSEETQFEFIMETEIVHSGRQSMPFFYTNTEGVTESVASRTFDPPMPWHNIDRFTVWIVGALENSEGQFLVEINDQKVYLDVDLTQPVWQKLEIDLDSLDTDLEMVTSLGIGVDGEDAEGILFIDDLDWDLESDVILEFVIGDFEEDLDGWELTEEVETKPDLAISQSTIGATSGSTSLALTPHNGWAWAVQRAVDVQQYDTLSLDVTWVAAEWEPSDSSIWVNFKEIAVQSGNDEDDMWSEFIPSDPLNPDWPGSWDPGNWGDHTRTLTWDISSHVPAEDHTWMKIIWSVNMGGGVITPGNYYIDNVKLIPSPPKIVYVDATEGETGNTMLATGEIFLSEEDSDGSDNLWRGRAYANNGTIFEAGGEISETDNTEDCPRLVTMIEVPEAQYTVYAYFWADENSWCIRGSLTNDEGQLPLYLANDPTTSATLANPDDFEAEVMVSEDNRELWQVELGTITTSLIEVYIDDDPRHMTHYRRTWYDGIGYKKVK